MSNVYIRMKCIRILRAALCSLYYNCRISCDIHLETCWLQFSNLESNYNKLRFKYHHIAIVSKTKSHQYRFRTNKSTKSASYSLLNFVYSQLDQENHVASLMFDQSRAFDTVDEDLLTTKLYNIGIGGNLLNCIFVIVYMTIRKIRGNWEITYLIKKVSHLVFLKDQCWDYFYLCCMSTICQISLIKVGLLCLLTIELLWLLVQILNNYGTILN